MSYVMSYCAPRSKKDLNDYFPTVIGVFAVIIFLMILDNTLMVSVNADPMSGIKDVFQSETFTGNTKWLENFNWVGRCIQFVITIFGYLIGIIVFFQIIITVLYFSFKELWEMVDTVKKQNEGVITYTLAGTSAWKSRASKGSDVLMTYAILLLPNIKRFSEASSDDADPNWTLTTWLMSTFIKKCLILLLVSMIINGSLMRAYLVVVNGMGVAANRFVEYDSEAFVNDLFKQDGANYKFALGESGEGFDVTQGKIAAASYAAVMKNSKDLTTEDKINIGSSIETYIQRNVTRDVATSVVMPKTTEMKEEDWERVRVEVVANATPSSPNSLTVKAGDLGIENQGKQNLYLHVYMTRRANNDPTNYWGAPKNVNR